MEKYLPLVIFFFGFIYCTKTDSIPSVIQKSSLDKNEIHSKSEKEDSHKNKELKKYESENADDLKNVYDYYKLSIGRKEYENYDDNYRENNKEKLKRLDQIYGYTGPSANDEAENLIRPCVLQDWECIRKYFAANGKCKPAYGPIPDPLLFDTMTASYTVVNVTAIYPFVMFRGLSSVQIRDFYFNKKSNNLVFAIDVKNFNLTAPRFYFRYHRTAKEPITLGGYGTDNFRSVTFTAVIPKAPHLRLDLADIHADLQDGTPTFFISPDAFASTDPDVVSATAEFFPNIPRLSRERVLFQAQLITATYIQKSICDFGLKLISA